jgi:hypothetical protein
MRIGTALLGALALASLAQGCESKTVNNSNTTNTVNSNSNTSSQTHVNNNDAGKPTPSPAPALAENSARANGNTNANTPPQNQKKIPYYGELGNDAPPAKIPAKKPEPKSSPR